jgi:hypothetical protein
MNKDWRGDRNSVFKGLGASNHTDKEREENDYYATDPIAIDLLVENETLNNVLECSCGEGHLSERMKSHNINVRSIDLIDRGYGEVMSFFDVKEWNGDIVTNPPYKIAQEFIEHSLNIVNDGSKVCMFLKLQFLEGKKRKKLFTKYPPKTLYVSSSRILCAKNADFEGMKKGGGSAVAYAWYVWEKGYSGDTIIKWIN